MVCKAKKYAAEIKVGKRDENDMDKADLKIGGKLVAFIAVETGGLVMGDNPNYGWKPVVVKKLVAWLNEWFVKEQ